MKTNLLLAGWLMLFLAPAVLGCSKDKTNDMVTVSSNGAVSIQNMKFNPMEIQVAQGGTVTWTNNDNMAHTVISDIGLFSSGTLQPGQTYSHTFNDLGQFFYHCELHPEMTGSVLLGR